jgi:ornithine cyclodeaminase
VAQAHGSRNFVQKDPVVARNLVHFYRTFLTMQFISDDQIRASIQVTDVLPAMRQAFAALGSGRAANLARSRVASTAWPGGRSLSVMGGILPANLNDGRSVMGAKVYPTVDGQFNFVIPLFCADSGQLLAVVQGNALTELRTAAVTLLAAEFLATPTPTTLVVCGSGIQARAHAMALCSHYALQRVWVVDPHGNAAALAADLHHRFGVAAQTSTAQEAVPQAQLLVLATRAKDPLFPGEWVSPGTFVAAIGSSKPDTRETDDVLLSRCACVVVEEKIQALREAGDLVLASDSALQRGRVLELGALVNRQSGWTRQRDDITLYKSVGIGLEDVALARLAWQMLQSQ